MKLIVSHADTIYAAYNQENDNILNDSKLHINIERMKKSDTLLACFAMFNEKPQDGYNFNNFEKFYSFYKKILFKYQDYIQLIDKFDDIQTIYNNGKTPIMMTIEDMGPFYQGLEEIDYLYDLGVRMASFTWNYENTYGFPNSKDLRINSKGLTEKGIQAIEKMNSKGIILDISHLSDGGISDMLKYSKKPIIASHSNSRSVTNHPRNCTDQQIKSIAENGGFLGINFCDAFLHEKRIASVENIVKHIDYIANVGGINSVAIGSDFDGINDKCEILHIDDMQKLCSALNKNGYSDDNIEKIFYKNAYNTFKEILK